MSFVLCYKVNDEGAGVQFYDSDFSNLKQENFAILSRKLVDAKTEEGLATGRKFKQILPYICIMRDGKNGKEILSYSRGKVGDSRMAAKRSVGFGGHVDLDDVVWESGNIDIDRTLNDAAFRELDEELGLGVLGYDLKKAFCLSDNTNEVGTVHLGVVYLASLLEGVNPQSSDECRDLRWVNPTTLSDDDKDLYESWSKIILNMYSL